MHSLPQTLLTISPNSVVCSELKPKAETPLQVLKWVWRKSSNMKRVFMGNRWVLGILLVGAFLLAKESDLWVWLRVPWLCEWVSDESEICVYGWREREREFNAREGPVSQSQQPGYSMGLCCEWMRVTPPPGTPIISLEFSWEAFFNSPNCLAVLGCPCFCFFGLWGAGVIETVDKSLLGVGCKHYQKKNRTDRKSRLNKTGVRLVESRVRSVFEYRVFRFSVQSTGLGYFT